MNRIPSALLHLPKAVVAAALLAIPPHAAEAAVTFIGAGTSVEGNPVQFRADLAISGDVLTLDLFNTSPVSSKASADVLTSFYFDIVNGANSRPTMNYGAASGNVFLVLNNAPDVAYEYTPPTPPSIVGTYVPGTNPSSLKAVNTGDNTWQFRAMDPSFAPYQGFGIGTVGNSGLSPNNFNPFIVDQIDFAIYKDGDISPVGNLDGRFLVKDSATFTFSGLTGFTEADISPIAMFGLGTKPDSVITVPEPGTLALTATGLLTGGLGLLRRRIKRPRVPTFVAMMLALSVFCGSLRATPFDATYDFANGPQGWTSHNTSADGFDYTRKWTWGGGTWNVEPTPVFSSEDWVANNLTSPRISIDPQTDALQLTVIHRYRFPTNIKTGGPVVAGQLVYRFGDSNNPFLPFAPSDFASGPVAPEFQSLTPYPTWVGTDDIAPGSLNPPLVATGGLWKGESPGFASGQFVASQVLLEGLVPGEEIEFRFINANLGLECTGGRWEIASVDVRGLLVPEPTSLTLAATGSGIVAMGWLRRRGWRRHPEPVAHG